MFSALSDRWKLVLQLLFVGILCAGIGFLIIFLNAESSSEGSKLVEFRVEASGGVAVITLDAEDAASISKPTTVSVPWIKSLRIASGTEVYLTATNPTQTGKLTCSITLDKIPWKAQTTNAPKNGVACAGIVP